MASLWPIATCGAACELMSRLSRHCDVDASSHERKRSRPNLKTLAPRLLDLLV